MKLFFRTHLKQPLKVVSSHFDQELFEFLTPVWANAQTTRFDGCKLNDEIHLRMKVGGLKQEWVSVITSHTNTDSEWAFTDEGKILPWPLKYWCHKHRIVRINKFRCEIIDDIEYKCATPLLEKMIYPVMWATFSIRPDRYRAFFRN